MKDRELYRQLLKMGWKEIRCTGSHHRLIKEGKHITIAVHGKELKKGTAHKILKDAGML